MFFLRFIIMSAMFYLISTLIHYSKLPHRTSVFAFVTEPWRLSSLSTGAPPKKALLYHYPYFLLKRTGIQKQNICMAPPFQGITGATTIDHIFSTSTHT